MDDYIGVDWALPAQHKATRESFDFRPKAMEAWRASLPMANVRETSRLLYQALDETNHLQIKPPARAALLEQLAETLNYISEGLRREYLGSEFPLREAARKQAELVAGLHEQAATAWRIVLQDCLRGHGRLGRKALARAVEQALHHTATAITEHFLVYQPPTPGSWQTVHELYRLAAARQLLDLEVAAPGAKNQQTVARRYLRLVLLAAAGPYRMRQDEIQHLDRLLERWAGHARLRPGDAGIEAMFRVNLHGDQGPLPGSQRGEQQANTHLLDTTGMMEAMQQELSPPRRWWRFWARPQPHPQAALIQRAMLALGVVPRRQYSRSHSSGRAEVVAGLSAVHRALAHEQGVSGEQQASRFVARDVAPAGQEEGERSDVWELVYPSELEQAQAADTGKPAPVARASTAQAPRWRLVNISAGGYCLLSDPSQSARVQVGELIGIRELGEHQAASLWHVGVVRWMKQIKGEGLQVGVQVIAPSPAPVMLSPELDDGRFGPEERGLLLPEVLPLDQPVSLATPGLHFQSGRRARIRGMGSESTVRLGKALESTDNFSQFDFRNAAAEQTAGGEFDPVWSTPG
ncbi:hypothetical protein [Alkalilimnicola sp. S0819]|uniref:hypothetical protein n=1 Tax=Alkalilimnicola sp. S0819 TaxID=2613922 RepID=UPI00126257D3|nr:hypothetical protein [Alkalilimnicola sp. S0819]KAB7627832.1 hypothetical protein F3N43_02320 [Alkalilimnicola sp. S0819]MPQ15464.1 hypothetical protein [Alkalilimnicola sp. S0819]